MKRLGYVFKKDTWMEVQAPGFGYYHKLAKLDEMFSEDMLRHHVDMPWMAKPYFYSSDIRGLHRAKSVSYTHLLQVNGIFDVTENAYDLVATEICNVVRRVIA